MRNFAQEYDNQADQWRALAIKTLKKAVATDDMKLAAQYSKDAVRYFSTADEFDKLKLQRLAEQENQNLCMLNCTL